jgi:hypothetical protein
MRDIQNVTLRLLGGLGSSTFATWLGGSSQDGAIQLRRHGQVIRLSSEPFRLLNQQRCHMVAQYQQGDSTQMPTNLWQPGVSGNPAGRLRGSRNRLSEAVICALLRDFSKHGEKAIAKVRQTQPAAYLKICALLVPREMKLEHSGGVKAMTDEQLERGIELIKEMLAKREAGANAKVIEGVAEPAALPAPRKPSNG